MALQQLKCELSWSASRAREFARCKRENWYARYASWGWWTEEPRGEKFEVMTLKSLTSLPAFAGDCMHRAIERWFQLRKAGTTMTARELYEEARELFRSGWRQSTTDAWKARPNKNVHLWEHQYGQALAPERLEAVRAHLERCARNFCEHPALAPAREAHPDSWRAVESLDTYRFLGTKVYAVPDFAYEAEDVYHIWDWKTGRPREEDHFQLMTYALYACEKWHADPEAIRLHAAYIGTGKVEAIPVDIETLSAAQDRVSESLREMMEVHYDPDVDPVVLEHWPTDGAPEGCPSCRFLAICPGARESATAPRA